MGEEEKKGGSLEGSIEEEKSGNKDKQDVKQNLSKNIKLKMLKQSRMELFSISDEAGFY